MTKNSKQTGKPWIKILSEDEIERIHERSLAVLENTGIQVEHEMGLKTLEEAGAAVDYETQRVKIPADLVARCLESAPAKYTLAARNPEKDCVLEPGGRPYSRNGGGSDYTLDLETGEFRPLLRDDMRDYFRLMDGLDHIDFIAPVYGHDLPVHVRDALVMRDLLANTDKHVHMRAYTKKTLEYIFKMAEIVAGGKVQLKERPILSLLESPISPLRFVDITVDALWLCGEYGIPIELGPMPISGATGPMTMAGNVLLFNAEFLGCVVISQVLHPGTPLEYAPRPMIMDMSSGIGSTGSIEAAMTSVAGAQLAAHYNIPVSLHGPWTDSMIPDGQSTFERTYFALMAAFAGAHVLSGSGMVHQGLTFSHVQLVIDDEINSTLLKALEGFSATEEYLGVDAIDRVGPGGNFLTDEHTFKFLREERYVPQLLFRETRNAWEAGGSKSFRERAKERAMAIIKEHQPNPLPEDISKALDDLVSNATRLLEAE